MIVYDAECWLMQAVNEWMWMHMNGCECTSQECVKEVECSLWWMKLAVNASYTGWRWITVYDAECWLMQAVYEWIWMHMNCYGCALHQMRQNVSKRLNAARGECSTQWMQPLLNDCECLWMLLNALVCWLWMNEYECMWMPLYAPHSECVGLNASNCECMWMHPVNAEWMHVNVSGKKRDACG